MPTEFSSQAYENANKIIDSEISRSSELESEQKQKAHSVECYDEKEKDMSRGGGTQTEDSVSNETGGGEYDLYDKRDIKSDNVCNDTAELESDNSNVNCETDMGTNVASKQRKTSVVTERKPMNISGDTEMKEVITEKNTDLESESQSTLIQIQCPESFNLKLTNQEWESIKPNMSVDSDTDTLKKAGQRCLSRNLMTSTHYVF